MKEVKAAASQLIKEDTPDLGSERIRQLYKLVDTDLPVDYIVYRPKEVTEWLMW